MKKNLFVKTHVHCGTIRRDLVTSNGLGHRRRIKREEKAMVIASVWVEEFIQILAALAVSHWTI